MRVAVLGAGAMGAIFGLAFRRVGAEVVFFDKRADVVEAIISEGLFLDGVFPATTTKFSATAVPAELGKVDLALGPSSTRTQPRMLPMSRLSA